MLASWISLNHLMLIADHMMGKKTRMKWRKLDILETDQKSSGDDVLMTDETHPFFKVCLALLVTFSSLMTASRWRR